MKWRIINIDARCNVARCVHINTMYNKYIKVFRAADELQRGNKGRVIRCASTGTWVVDSRCRRRVRRRSIAGATIDSGGGNGVEGALPAATVAAAAVVFRGRGVDDLVAAAAARHQLLQADYRAQHEGDLRREQGRAREKGDLAERQLGQHACGDRIVG